MRLKIVLNTLGLHNHVCNKAQGSESKHVSYIQDIGVYSCNCAIVRLCMYTFALTFAACAHLTVFPASRLTRRPPSLRVQLHSEEH